jgi:hypothetical protein
MENLPKSTEIAISQLSLLSKEVNSVFGFDSTMTIAIASGPEF